MVKISKSVIGQKSETARAVTGLVFGLGPQKGRGLFGLGPQKGRGLFVWKRIVSEFVFPQHDPPLLTQVNQILRRPLRSATTQTVHDNMQPTRATLS